jgi:hypothetical protein
VLRAILQATSQGSENGFLGYELITTPNFDLDRGRAMPRKKQVITTQKLDF